MYGFLAEFHSSEALIHAAQAARQAGYKAIDAYSPFPVEELSEALGQRRTKLPWVVFFGGLTGAATGLGMQTIASVWHYPWNVGGRPFFSWPTFIPITFELTILFSAFAAVIGMLIFNGLPRLHHPVFNVAEFEKASRDGYFLCIEAKDPQFEKNATRAFLENLKPLKVHEVPE